MKKIFSKIHLWLSIPFGICITLICFSGAMLVFEKEITESCRHDLYFVKGVKSRPLPIDSLMKCISAELPDSVSVTGLTISSDPGRAWQASLSKPRRASIYVDQYTGEVKGRNERLPFFTTMFRLHRWMMGSSNGAGKMIVGISTLMLVIILLTGLLMWLTNRNKPLAKSLRISFTKGWPRFWHDLHVAGGIYVTVFLLALALTGLTWSFSWYRSGFYRILGAETSAVTGGQQQNTRQNAVHGQGRNAGRAQSQSVHWQTVYDSLLLSCPEYRQITISDGSASVVPKGRMSLRSGDRYEFNPHNGKIISVKPYKEQDKAAKIRSAVYTVHVGSWGGMLTRILTFIAAMLGATLPITGYYLWIKKLIKKKKPHVNNDETR